MLKPFMLIIILVFSFSQSEIRSSNILSSTIFPLIFVISLLLLLVWFLRRFDKNRNVDEGSGDGGNAYYLSGKNNDSDAGDSGGDGGSD